MNPSCYQCLWCSTCRDVTIHTTKHPYRIHTCSVCSSKKRAPVEMDDQGMFQCMSRWKVQPKLITAETEV